MNRAATLPEVRAALAGLGAVSVQTFGGPVALAAWNPYGASPGGVNHRPGDRPWRGVLRPDGTVLDHHDDVAPGFVLGVWVPVLALPPRVGGTEGAQHA